MTMGFTSGSVGWPRRVMAMVTRVRLGMRSCQRRPSWSGRPSKCKLNEPTASRRSLWVSTARSAPSAAWPLLTVKRLPLGVRKRIVHCVAVLCGIASLQQGAFLRRHRTEKRRQALGPGIPVEGASQHGLFHLAAPDAATRATKGAVPERPAGVTGEHIRLQARPTGRAKGARTQGITLGTGLHTVIEEHLALYPEPLTHGQGLLIRHDPAALREQFEEAPPLPARPGVRQVLVHRPGCQRAISPGGRCPPPGGAPPRPPALPVQTSGRVAACH